MFWASNEGKNHTTTSGCNHIIRTESIENPHREAKTMTSVRKLSMVRRTKLVTAAIFLLQISDHLQHHNQVLCWAPQMSSESLRSLNVATEQQLTLADGGGGGLQSLEVFQPANTARTRIARAPAAASIEEPTGGDLAVEDPSLADGPAPVPHRTQPEDSSRQAPDVQPLKHLAGGSKLRIVRLLAPEATQNGTQNVTLDCMFKFDKNLDQRLTIKWFFNDELEPIYQWIPELNKRVYSDKYERYLDKSYEVSEDVDFMLQSYRWLLAGGGSSGGVGGMDTAAGEPPIVVSGNAAAEESAPAELELQVDAASRRLLAGRLNKLAKLGGRHSRQLIDSLRAALYMDELEVSRFRALRLLRPTSELNGRFTCSVSSLDGDDLRSTKLVVYEPAKSFSFNVSRLASGQQYNLSCQAGQLFPRPTLALYRYRAGPLEQPAAAGSQASSLSRHRPKLAATQLRQEPLAGTQTQVTISATTRQRAPTGQDPFQAEANDIRDLASELDFGVDQQQQSSQSVYEIASWALVDESSLSSNVLTQFECQLYIEGTGYEQRQTLSLQRGWHVNSAALASRHALVSLFSALASLLCLTLALVSSMLVFRLLRRHAKNRVHQLNAKAGNSSGDDFDTSGQPSTDGGMANNNRPKLNTLTDILASPEAATLALPQTAQSPHKRKPEDVGGAIKQQLASEVAVAAAAADSDGVYRVPEPSLGTRFIIGPGSGVGHYYGGGANIVGPPTSSFASARPAAGRHQHTYQQQQQQQRESQQQRQPPINSSVEQSRPLYC